MAITRVNNDDILRNAKKKSEKKSSSSSSSSQNSNQITRVDNDEILRNARTGNYQTKKTYDVDRNYVTKLSHYASGADGRVGNAQEYYDYLRDNEDELRGYMGAGSYDIALKRLNEELIDAAAAKMRAERGVYSDAPYKGIAPQIAVDIGLRRSGAIAPNNPIAAATNDGGTNAYAQALRRTTLEREKARLNSLPATNLQEAEDYEERMAAIDLALGKVQGNLNDLDRAGRVNREISNAKANADFAEKAKQGAQMSQGASAQWKLVNDPQGMRNETLRQNVGMGDRQNLRTIAAQEAYQHLSNEERDVFNYIYATEGSDAANAYLEDLRESLTTRRAQAEVREAETLARNNPLFANAMSVAGTLEGGLAYGEAALGRMLGQEIDLNDPLYDVARMRSTVREATGENIAKSVTDKTNSKFLGEAATFGYQTAMSMADSLMAAGLSAIGGGAVGATMLAGSAANDTMMQAKERGASDDQALLLGGLAGVAEALFEKVSIENFLKEAAPGVRGAWVLNVLRQMGIEASEESATEVANIITESLVMGDQSQYAGMSAGELAGQVALAGLGGALSGGAMGGIASTTGAVQNAKQDVATGKEVFKAGAQRSVVQNALDSQNKAALLLANQLQDGTAKMNNRNVGRLYNLMEQDDPLRRAAMEVAGVQMEEQTTQQPTQTAQEPAREAIAEPEEDYTLPETTAPAVAQTRTDAAVNARTGENVQVAGIDSVDDGVVFVKDADGDVVRLADMRISDPQTAALYNAASEFDTATAQRFVAGYEGGDVQQYIQSFTSVYKDGQAGIPYETTLNQRISAQNLTENQRIDAYAGGVASNRPTVNAAKLKPGLTRSYTKASLSREAATALKKHRRQIEAIDVMAKKYGRKVVLVSSLEGMTIGGETIDSAVNGAYDRSTGTIYIAADAQDGAFAYVAMHEMVHSIRKDSADNFNRLRDTVFEALEASGEDIDALTKYQMEKFGYDEDSAIEEVIANTAPTVLTDEQFVRNLYANDRSLFDKIREFFEDLKKVFADLTQSGSWAQDAALNEESVRKIAEVFEQVAAETADRPRNRGAKQSRLDPEFADGIDVEANIKTVALMDSVETVTGEEFKKDPDRDLVTQVADFFESVGNVAHNPDIGDVTLSKRGVQSDIAHGMGRKKAASFAAVPAVIENGKVIDVQYDWKGRGYDTVVIAAPIDIGADQYYMGVVVEKTIHDDRFYVHEVRIKKDGATAFKNGPSAKAGVDTVADTPSVLSLLQKIIDVKTDTVKFSAKDSSGRKLTKEQQEFFADSKVRDENGNLMVMYHGTPYGGFTEFRSASYFTSNKAYADIYHNPSASSLRGRYNPASNEMTYEVYLNITKPFDTRKAKERRIFQNEYYRKWGNGTPLSESGLPDWTDGMDLQEFIEEMEYDYDGLILDEGGYPGENGEVVSRGLSYVVFNASQVKNVDNTNPTEDPDIRFSMRDTTPANTRRLERENTKLKAALTNARAQLKLTSGHEVSRPAVERLARKIIRTTQSKVDASKLANDLMQIYSYAATSGNSDTALREIDSIGIGVAKKIIQQAESVDTVSAEQFADLKEYLRTTGITLNESQRADAAAMYGSYGDFRKEYFGKIKLVKDGVPLDVAWGELNHRYPWLFNAEGDNMLEALVHAADLTQPQLVNPYAEDIDGAAADLWLTIQNEYVNLPEVRTFADKQKEKIDKLRAEQRQLIADMRREAQRRMEDTRTAERIAEGRKQAAAQQKADARMEAQQERADARIAALEARIRELEQQVKDERAAGQINAAVERKAGRQAVEEARTAERMAEGRIRSEERQRAAERLEAQKQRDAEKLREVREQRDQKRVQDLREQRETINAQRKERDEQTKYRERIMANAKTLTAWLTRPTDEKHVPESMRKVIAKFLETLEWGDGTKRTQKGDLWRSRLMEMLLVMERIDKAADEGQALDIDPDLTARMEEFLGGVPDTITSIGNLSTEQLRDLDYILQTVKRTVVYANRTRANKLYASVSAVGDATITEMDLAKGKSKFWQTFSAADKFFNIQQLDSFSFFAGLGEAAESILYELRDGFDAKIKHVQQAVEYVKPFTDGLKMREISGKQAKLHTFQLNDGEVKMTTAQIMELYELLKREQARGHIFGSGIRIADISRGKLAAEVKQIDPVQITVEEAQTIVDSLTDKQKQLADRLAWFMGNECAAWGNETSVLMYGYKKFTEQNYYPIHSDSNFILTSDKNDKGQQGAFAALKNLGMTKQVQRGAHNPIIVGDIFDTFTQHVDDMASYNGMMPALSDAMKWYNFKAENETGKVKSVKRSMERRAGVHAKGYFETLIKQLNGVNDRGERIGITNWLTSHAKAAAVGANLRVVLQQPSAYVRAAAVIDPKYLLEGVGKAFAKGNRAMAKEYSPIALWKSWGYYDISVGKDMRSLLFNDSNIDERMREWSMAPAGWADEMTWGALFRACLAEQKDIHPDWSEDQQKTAAGRRLSEIVDLTQVVDSPFHKSQLMRSSDGLVRMQTAFMAEPTKTYNLLRTSLVKAIEKKDKASIKQFGRTAVTWLVSAATTAAFAAIADVGRDDDDDQTVLEKYGEALSANLIDNVNLLNSIPFVKDILSLLEGYEPSRLDMQAADKLINVGKVWLKQLNAEKGEKPYTHWYMAYQTAQAVSSITGIPVGNLMREVDAIASTFGADLKTKTIVASATERYEKLYGAIVEGKDKKVERIEAALREDEKSPKDIDSGIAKVLAAQDDRIAEAYEARERGDIATLDEIRDELAELFGEEVVDKALNLYENGAEKEPSEKNLNETLSAPLFDYADMEVVALQAFETGDTDALERVIAEIKADSDAQNPDQAVRTKATTLFKPVYLKAKSRGYTKQAARIKKILIEVFGMKAETIDKWKEK